MQITDNYEAKIWLGLREGYTRNYFRHADVMKVIQSWCTEKKQCVSITPTQFVYVQNDETGEGSEHGVVIGFINYPRYPMSEAEIRNRARELGGILMKEFKQYRVSITFYPSMPGGTMMLENEELE